MSHGPYIAILLFAFSISEAEPLTIAVTSSFTRPAQEIAAAYEGSSGNPVRMTTASTGKLYAQITNGAPFDIFLAADTQRPQLLERSGLGVAGTRFNYAIGSLVLWSLDPTLEAGSCKTAVDKLDSKRLAIANPVTAPYGLAAMEFLQAQGVWEKVRPNLVYGENIAQTLHFVVSRNASLGLIAGSQAADVRLPDATCHWPVPASMHQPLDHQAILLQHAAGNRAATAFLRFLRDDDARQIIHAHGYRLPE